MLIPFIDGDILVASFFEIIPESLLRFIDLEYCCSMAGEYIYKAVLACMIADKILYIICDIYDIKRFFCLVCFAISTIHLSDYK